MKTCSKCGIEKEVADFPWKSKPRGVRGSWCKACQREYSLGHYKDNTTKYLDKAKISNAKAIKRNKEFIVEYLRNNSCVDCGEIDIEVLQFDHIELVGQKAPRAGYFLSSSLETLRNEIARCQVRCGNCHIRRTRQQLGFFRNMPV